MAIVYWKKSLTIKYFKFDGMFLFHYVKCVLAPYISHGILIIFNSL